MYVCIGTGISSSQDVTCLFSWRSLMRIKCRVECSRAGTHWPLHLDRFPSFVKELSVSQLPIVGLWRVFWSWVVSFRAYQMCSLHHLIWPSISRLWHFLHTCYNGYATTSWSYQINFLAPAAIVGLHHNAAVVWNFPVVYASVILPWIRRFRIRWWHFLPAAYSGYVTRT
jgi:hypothetical protein